MEFNQKLRGQKHHKNKARYKSKPTTHKVSTKNKVFDCDSQKPVNQSSSIDVHSSSSDVSENEHLDATNKTAEWNDFSLLAQAPISVGGHFQFKSDKNVEAEYDFEGLQQNNLFSLDLNILQYSLNCIPFFERCGLDKQYFTESDLNDMKARSQMNKVQYDSYLKIISVTKEVPEEVTVCKDLAQNETCDSLLDESKINKCVNQLEQQETEAEQYQQNLKNLDTQRRQETEVNKSELEDWLDEILGD